MPPLPPLPEDNTPRGYINYTSGGISHVMQARFPTGSAFGPIADALSEIATVMLPVMATTDSVQTYEASEAGSNVRFIIGTDGRLGTNASGVVNDLNSSAAFSVTGKGSDGRLVACSFFTVVAGSFVDVRIAIGVAAPILADWYAGVTANPEVPLVNIGGASVNWNGYINIRRDAYWQRAQR